MTTETAVPSFNSSPEYLAREKRFNDAVSLTKPDRVPLASLASFFMTRYAGLTNAEAMYDYERMAEAWKYSVTKLNLDMAPPSFTVLPGPVLNLLGLQTFKWPGGELNKNLPYQFVEKEYMLTDEYDEMLKNPSDFVVRKLIPRMSKTLEPLGTLPPLLLLSSGHSLAMTGAALAGIPAFAAMLQQLVKAGEEMNKWLAVQSRLGMELAQLGYPTISVAFAVTPFDWISDMLRGLKGSVLDMYRQPDKLKAAIDLFTPLIIQLAMTSAQQAGNKRIFIPLHRGAAGFMSNQQFKEFYWPGLKKTISAFTDAGLTPMPFFEGDYTSRLEFLAELPPGKVLGHFDIVDKKKAKKIIGDNMCFWGNVPAQMLVTGLPEQVKDYVKELIDTFGDNGGLIVDGAVDGVPPESRPENVEAMIETVFQYGVY